MENPLQENNPDNPLTDQAQTTAPQQSSLPTIQTPTEPTPPAKSKKQLILVVIIIATILSLGISAFFIYQNYQLKKQTAQTQPTPIPPTATQPTPTPDPTANWKTYKNEEYKFIINYPGDWKYEERTYESSRDKGTTINEILFSPIQVFDINPGVFSITIYKPVQDLTLEAFVDTYLCFPLGEGGVRCSSVPDDTIKFSLSMPARKIAFNPMAHHAEAAVVQKDGVFYEFEIDFEKPIYENKNVSPDERRELFNQILSTFKFLDNNSQYSLINANLDNLFNLKMNQVRIIDSENLQIKFLEVSEDSRCPSDVNCVWSGQVTIVINIAKNSQNLGNISLTSRPGNEGLAIENFDGYSIKLIKVDPYPKTTQEIKSSDYTATLVVSKS